MNANKKYTAFGLIIESEIDLPELITATGQADAAIVWGKIPAQLERPVSKTPWFETAGGRFLLRVDGIAGYYVENGNLIVIEPNKNAKPEDVRVFLLNTVLAALLHQRNYLVLHGAAAVVDGRAVALVGSSQVGKTAIALTLYDRGYPLLSDEICAVTIQAGQAVILRGIPQLNAWRDTLVAAGKDVSCCQPIRPGIEKYAFPIHEQFGETAEPLGKIILLRHHNRTTMDVESIKGGAKLEKLWRSTFFAETVADKTQHFKLFANIVNQAFLLQVTFNQHPYRINQVTDFILKELK